MSFEQFIEKVNIFFSSKEGLVVLFFLVILGTFVLVRFIKGIFKRNIIDRVISPSDPTNYVFLQHIITAIVYVAGFATALQLIPSLKALSASMLAGAGIFAVAIGFASQKAFANIISGLFIVIFKPFRVNDRVNIGIEVAGIVEDITLRHTVVRSYENKRFIIPNAVISEQIIVNSDIVDNDICKFILFKVDYNSDLEKALSIISEEAENHPLAKDRRTEAEIEKNAPKATVKVFEWGNHGIVIRAAVWAEGAADAFTITCDLNRTVKHRFDEAGIKIPIAHL
jgi:small-conductance mechanosensitive channel